MRFPLSFLCAGEYACTVTDLQREYQLRFYEEMEIIRRRDPPEVAGEGVSKLFNQTAADSITGSEGRDQASAGGRGLLLITVERNDRTRRRYVGEIIQTDRRFITFRQPAEQFFHRKHIHIDVGLMQPHTLKISRLQIVAGQLPFNKVSHQWQQFFKDFTAFLLEEGAFVGQIIEAVVGVVAITADVGRVLGELLSVQNTERMWAGAAVLAFNHHCGGAI